MTMRKSSSRIALHRKTSNALAAALLAATVLVADTALSRADPPPWAPAHGYRAKQHHDKGHADRHPYDAGRLDHAGPIGIDLGRCNRDVVGALLGGAAGAAAGSTIGKGDGRTAAMIGGAILGALVGGVIGQNMDEIDQNCVGQVLERAETGQTIVWNDPETHATYQVTPTRTYQPDSSDRYCREYTATAVIGGRTERTYGIACRQPDGSWRLAG